MILCNFFSRTRLSLPGGSSSIPATKYEGTVLGWLLFSKTLRPQQNGWYFAGSIFKYILLNNKFYILIKISPKMVAEGPAAMKSALVYVMAWHRTGDKPLPEPMMTNFYDTMIPHVCPCLLSNSSKVEQIDLKLGAQLTSNIGKKTLLFFMTSFLFFVCVCVWISVLFLQVSYCPIDTSLSFAQANKLIRELKPIHLVLAEQYLSPPIMFPHNTNLKIDCVKNKYNGAST